MVPLWWDLSPLLYSTAEVGPQRWGDPETLFSSRSRWDPGSQAAWWGRLLWSRTVMQTSQNGDSTWPCQARDRPRPAERGSPRSPSSVSSAGTWVKHLAVTPESPDRSEQRAGQDPLFSTSLPSLTASGDSAHPWRSQSELEGRPRPCQARHLNPSTLNPPLQLSFQVLDEASSLAQTSWLLQVLLPFAHNSPHTTAHQIHLIKTFSSHPSKPKPSESSLLWVAQSSLMHSLGRLCFPSSQYWSQPDWQQPEGRAVSSVWSLLAQHVALKH